MRTKALVLAVLAGDTALTLEDCTLLARFAAQAYPSYEKRLAARAR